LEKAHLNGISQLEVPTARSVCSTEIKRERIFRMSMGVASDTIFHAGSVAVI